MTWYSSAMPLAPCMSRATRAMSSALPAELRLSIDTASCAAVPSSNRRPRRRHAASPTAISVCMSASFFCTSWLAASGRPNCRRSSTYSRAACQQNSAAPSAPQADAVAGAGEASERTLQPGGVRQLVRGGDEDAVHRDLAGGRRPQRELAVDLRGGQALRAPLEDESADDALVVLRPDHEDVGDRGVADPGLRSRQQVAAVDRACPGGHRAGVGAGVGLGESEAAYDLAGRELRQVLRALRFAAVGVNGVHDEARLHADGRAVAGVHPLDLAGDEPVAHVSDAGAAVPVDGGAEEPELPHLAHDRGVEMLGAVRIEDAGHQGALRVVACRLPDHAFLLGERALEQQRVAPVEARGRGGSGGSDVLGGLGHGGVSVSWDWMKAAMRAAAGPDRVEPAGAPPSPGWTEASAAPRPRAVRPGRSSRAACRRASCPRCG